MHSAVCVCAHVCVGGCGCVCVYMFACMCACCMHVYSLFGFVCECCTYFQLSANTFLSMGLPLKVDELTLEVPESGRIKYLGFMHTVNVNGYFNADSLPY